MSVDLNPGLKKQIKKALKSIFGCSASIMAKHGLNHAPNLEK